jgi:tetratricopeptide (TPR) repeat protein
MLDRRGVHLAAAGLALLLCAAPVWGQPARQDTARFRELVKDATTAYGAGQLEESIALLRKAYRLKQDPRLLYNIAKAQEGLAHWQEAIDGYREYLRKAPDAPNGDLVAGRIAVLEKQALERQRQIATAERLAAERAETAGQRDEAIARYQRYLELAPTAEDRASVEARIAELRRAKRPAKSESGSSTPASTSIAPWLIVGVGTAGVATGTVFAVLSRGKYDDARGADTGQAADDSRKTGDTFTTVGNVAIIAGGVVVAGGLTWVILRSGSSSGEKRGALNLTLAPTGVALGGTL